MPYKRNDSAYWWISFKSATGKLVRRSSGTADYSAAKALEQQERAKAWKEKEMGVNPPRTFEEVIIPYLQHARQHQRSYETTVHRIKPLREYFAGRVINDLGGQDIRGYGTHRLDAGADQPCRAGVAQVVNRKVRNLRCLAGLLEAGRKRYHSITVSARKDPGAFWACLGPECHSSL